MQYKKDDLSLHTYLVSVFVFVKFSVRLGYFSIYVNSAQTQKALFSRTFLITFMVILFYNAWWRKREKEEEEVGIEPW